MADSGVFDSSEAHEHFFIVPGGVGTVSGRVMLIIEATYWIRFREFTAPATAAASGGGATSGAGGASTPTSGSSSISTTAPDRTHSHFVNDPGGAGTWSSGQEVPIPGHAHGIAHTHAVTIAAHQHSTPAHAHGLTYGLFKEPMPASIDVNIGLWRKPLEGGGAWDLLGSISGLDQEEQYVDLTSFFNAPEPSGLYRLTFQSAPGQPNGGRLTVDVAGTMWMAVQSR